MVENDQRARCVKAGVDRGSAGNQRTHGIVIGFDGLLINCDGCHRVVCGSMAVISVLCSRIRRPRSPSFTVSIGYV